MALYIFSDAHLGCDSEDQETHKVAKIAELFDRMKQDGDRLVILGDLFDFWFEYKHAIPKEHADVLLMLRGLVQSGIAVDYVSGNHDFWMDNYFETQIGVTLHRDSLDMEYGGKRLHLTHGDGLAKADRGYRFLKKILRNRFNIWLYRKLPPDWAIPLAKFVSGSSRDYTSQRDHTFTPDYEQYAAHKLTDDYDVVVIGHLHIPDLTELDGGTYVNSGDFINHFSYVKLDDTGVRLEYLRDQVSGRISCCIPAKDQGELTKNPAADQPDFYMSADEYDALDEPRKCYSIKRFSGGKRDNFLLIRIDPPIAPGEVEGFDSEISEVIVATRHQGATLFPISVWPLYVYVVLPAIPGINYRSKVIETEIGNLYLEAWAELFPTEDEARNKKMRWGYK